MITVLGTVPANAKRTAGLDNDNEGSTDECSWCLTDVEVDCGVGVGVWEGWPPPCNDRDDVAVKVQTGAPASVTLVEAFPPLANLPNEDILRFWSKKPPEITQFISLLNMVDEKYVQC